MPSAISTGVLVITAIVIATLLATLVEESTLTAAMLTRIEVPEMLDSILLAVLDGTNTSCVAIILRANTVDVSVKELGIAYYASESLSVNVTKKYGIVYEDPTTGAIMLSIEGVTQPIPVDNIVGTICGLLEVDEAAIIWFNTMTIRSKIGPGLPILLILKTPQTEKLLVEITSPKTPPIRIKAK